MPQDSQNILNNHVQLVIHDLDAADYFQGNSLVDWIKGAVKFIYLGGKTYLSSLPLSVRWDTAGVVADGLPVQAVLRGLHRGQEIHPLSSPLAVYESEFSRQTE